MTVLAAFFFLHRRKLVSLFSHCRMSEPSDIHQRSSRFSSDSYGKYASKWSEHGRHWIVEFVGLPSRREYSTDEQGALAISAAAQLFAVFASGSNELSGWSVLGHVGSLLSNFIKPFLERECEV